MNVRKFVANDARIALKKVKETLGPDAVILSNRTVDGQVEIMAVAARDMAMVVATPGTDAPVRRPAPALNRVQATYADDDFEVTLGQGPAALAKNSGQRHFVPEGAPPKGQFASRDESVARNTPPQVRRPLVSPPGPSPAAPAATEMMDELKALRRIVEQHLAGYAWGEYSRQQPAMTELLKRMLEAGFSPKLANELLATIMPTAGAEEAYGQVKTATEQKLMSLGGMNDIVDEGGVYALVGPTGVGKTTTTAKLAARCVLRHGREKVALITSDAYRIGAHEQLRAYGRIMGVPVYAIKDPHELKHTLRDLAQKHLVLIDTMGMSQRDRHVGEQISMFQDCGVKRLLLLNATSRGDTMDDVVSAYGGQNLAGCVLTKIDEAVSLAPAIDVLIRRALPVAYVTNGQRVPEDLHVPNAAYLVHRAFKAGDEASAHRYSNSEPALMMASAGYFPAAAQHA